MKREPKSEEQLIEQDRRRKEAAQEYERLKEHYAAARVHMKSEAILVAWFLLGDVMWEDVSEETAKANH